MTAPSDDELRALLAEATPGPWEFLEAHNHDDEWSATHSLTICSSDDDDLASIYSSADATVSIPRTQAVANAALIAAAPALAAEVLRLRAEAATARRDGAAALREAAATVAITVRATDNYPRDVYAAIRALPLPGDPT